MQALFFICENMQSQEDSKWANRVIILAATALLATTPEGRKNMSTMIPEGIRAVVQLV